MQDTLIREEIGLEMEQEKEEERGTGQPGGAKEQMERR